MSMGAYHPPQRGVPSTAVLVDYLTP